MMVGNGKAARGVLFHQALGDRLGLVGGVVQHLDVKLFQRILQTADRIQQALNHELLVENRKLHRNPGQFGKMAGRLHGAIFPVLVIEINQHVTVHAVRRQQDQHHKVRNQQRHVKGVGVIEAPEGGVEKMLPDVLADAPRGHESGQSWNRNRRDAQGSSPVVPADQSKTFHCTLSQAAGL